tara:strand:- start:425 stop:1060 length:636 start_codon:yes stop_codon:yes gene_type:complete
MADYPSTSTIFDKAGATHGTTRTGLSTQIIVYVNGEPVGAIQSFQETQQRNNKRIAEVGTDGWIEIVPQSPAQVSLTVSRIVFDGLSLPESFARGYKNIHAQRIPFDIVVVDKFAGGDDASKIVTVYHNCWFSNLSKSYTVNDYTITEQANIDCEYVSSQRAGQAVAETQGVGGGRLNEGKQRDLTEQAADRGDRRGVLDFAGLIEATYTE